MAVATLALLTQFEHQYSVNTAEITAKIGQLVTNLPVSERVSSINEIRKLLTDVEDLLEQMELSVWELDSCSPDRSKYDLRVKSYRNDKKHLDAELQKAIVRMKSDSNREELLNFDEGIGLDQDQLIDSTERLERTSRKIQDTYRVTVETEQIGAQVLGNLSQQREVLTRARDRMLEADADLSRSNKMLSQMIQRVIQNRLTLLVVAVVLMFMLMFMLFKAL